MATDMGPAQPAATPASMTPPARGAANASEKTLIVLEAALRHERFSDVVAATGLAKATAHRILTTLIDHKFLVLVGHRYQPGPTLLSLAGRALENIDISAIAQPFVDELVGRVHCTVHVGAANGDEVIYLIRSDSDKPYRMPSRVGHAIPMHSSGIGKSILADQSDEAVRRYAARTGLPARTPYTLTDVEALLAELREARERGFTLDDGENAPGVVCVAAPVRDHTGRAKYGVSISSLAVEHSHDDLVAMAPDAIATAEAISRSLGYTPHR
ncbi:IclR family transcriptional regulator [Puerhibacterium sp. TATVAM-FAB25]|uniref:IclR family transcriptional regulator n=1 Tax=Puerhibacterium sp. TATVAM-FAB25 TaxID=3093699 RepID=UPI0039793102